MSVNECAICLSVLDPRGGKQITTPGCCGQYFHQDCINQMINSGNKNCPTCRQKIKSPSSITGESNQPGLRSSHWFTFGGGTNTAPFGFDAAATTMQTTQTINTQWNPFTVFTTGQMQVAPQLMMAYPTSQHIAQGGQQPGFVYAAPQQYMYPPIQQPHPQPLQQLHQLLHQPPRRNSQSMRIQPSIQPPRMTGPIFQNPFQEDPLLQSDIQIMNLSAGSNTTTTCIAPPMIVTCQPEKSELGMQRSDFFFVNISLKSTPFDHLHLHRTPMDLVCILDNSGSMNGDKLDGVKQAMQFISTQLTSNDRLSVVSFNSTATILHGLKKMTTENKVSSNHALSQVTATGGTDIYTGLNVAFQTLFQRQNSHCVASVFLLTDGQDPQNGDKKTELCRRMRAFGYSLFAFGFGADHDAEQLKSLTDVNEGTFTYVEANESVAEAFGGALGGQQSMIATDVKLSVCMAPLSGCSIAKTFAGKYANQISPDQQRVDITFANMYAGETRDVLLQVIVPAVESLRNPENFHVLSAMAAYKQLDGQSKAALADNTSSYYDPLRSTAANCVIRRVHVEQPAATVVNLEVDAQKNRVMFLEATEAAKSFAGRRDMDSARMQIRSVRELIQSSGSCVTGHAVTMSLLEDLDQVDRGLVSTHTYECGGLSSIHDVTSDYAFQRSSRTKSSKKCQTPYQSTSSVAVQSSARTFCSPKGK